MSEAEEVKTADYVVGAAPGTYDHRGGECSKHGQTVFFKRYKVTEPFLCRDCSLEALGRMRDQEEFERREKVTIAAVTVKPPERKMTVVETHATAGKLLPEKMPSFTRQDRGIGEFTYSSKYTDAEFHATAISMGTYFIIALQTKVSCNLALFGMAVKEILGDTDVRVKFSESDVMAYRTVPA